MKLRSSYNAVAHRDKGIHGIKYALAGKVKASCHARTSPPMPSLLTPDTTFFPTHFQRLHR